MVFLLVGGPLNPIKIPFNPYNWWLLGLGTIVESNNNNTYNYCYESLMIIPMFNSYGWVQQYSIIIVKKLAIVIIVIR